MWKKIIQLTFISTLALAITYPAYQEGTQVGPAWTPDGNHVLQTGNEMERSLDVTVVFAKPFENVPEIALAPCIWDLQTLVPIGFSFQVQSVTKKDFVIRIKALTTRQIYTYKFNWIAIDDPRVHIEHVDILKPPQLSDGKADRQIVIAVPAKEWDLKQKEGIKVAPFIVGFQITQGNTISLFTKLLSYEKGQANIQISTTGDTLIQRVQLCVVFSNYEKFFVSETMGIRPVAAHSWHTGAGDRFEELSVKLPPNLLSGPRASLGGFTGFDLPIDKKNFRIILQKVSVGAKTASGKYGTWADTEVNQITFQILVYQSDDWPIFSQECAELFSECGFKGNSLKICANSNDVKKDGFKGPVKSVWIPKGRQLKLYNKVDLKGEEVIISQTEECIDGVNFQLIQID